MTPMPATLIEATALAALVALLARMCRWSAPVRHAMWVLVLVKLLLPEVVAHPFSLSAAARAVVDRTAEGRLGVPNGGSGTESDGAIWSDQELESRLSPELGPAGAVPSSEILSATSIVSSAWLVSTLGAAALVAFRIVRLGRRVAAARPAPEGVESLCRLLAARMGLSRVPQVVTLPGGFSPFVWPVGVSKIVLPTAMAVRAERETLSAVLAHELAHLRRCDHWVAWLECLALAAFWWLPTLHWTRWELRRAADEACDAWAADALGSREEYAESLVSVLEFLTPCTASPPLPSRGMGVRPARGVEGLKRRLTMIVSRSTVHRLTPRAALGVFLAALLALPAASERLAGQETPNPAQPAPPKPPQAPLPPPPAGSAATAGPAIAPVPPLPPPSADNAPRREAERVRQRAVNRDRPEGRVPNDNRIDELERKLDRVLDRLEQMESNRREPRAGVGLPQIQQGPRGLRIQGPSAGATRTTKARPARERRDGPPAELQIEIDRMRMRHEAKRRDIEQRFQAELEAISREEERESEELRRRFNAEREGGDRPPGNAPDRRP